MAKTDARLDRVAKMVGNMGDTNGDVAEECFYTTLLDNPQLGSVRFDEVMRHVKPKGDSGPEFDIVMTNGTSLALVEVKRKAHNSDIDKLMTDQVNHSNTSTQHTKGILFTVL